MSITIDEKLTNKSMCADDKQSSFLSDNPCWGDSMNCSLLDLLRILHRQNIIVQENPSYIVLNKPPDLRMDGNYRATVHKLLLYYFPPQSLSPCEEEGDAAGDPEHDEPDSTKSRCTDLLLEKIAVYHKFNEPLDNPMRPVHQLDYATSGCLLVCRTKLAAQLASESLSNRQAKKNYLAVLHGHVDVDGSWPVLSAAQFQETFQSIEYNYRRSRKKRQDGTFEGFLPPHAVFVQWKTRYTRQRNDDGIVKERHSAKKKRRKQTIDVLALWREMDFDKSISPNEQTRLTKESWKTVKTNKLYLDAFERLTNAWNDHTRQMDGAAQVNTPSLPRIFRVKGEEDDAFYMFGALAEVPNQFSMRLESDNPTGKDTKSGTLDFKPSLTRCVVLHRGNMTKTGQAVTKVQMEPKTGRRHQLRVHASQILGHTIVGDMAYATKECNGEENGCGRDSTGFARMCLHAHSLKLPPLLNETVSTSDPFPVDNETGEVNVELA